MIVAVVAVRMMEMSSNEVVNMVAMRNSGVTAIGTMHVIRGVFFRRETGCASVGIGSADFNDVFVHMFAVRMMQVAFVKIIHVTIMHDGNISAAGAVRVRMACTVL